MLSLLKEVSLLLLRERGVSWAYLGCLWILLLEVFYSDVKDRENDTVMNNRFWNNMKRTITRDIIGIPCMMKVRLYQWVTAVYRGLRNFISRRTKVVYVQWCNFLKQDKLDNGASILKQKIFFKNGAILLLVRYYANFPFTTFI